MKKNISLLILTFSFLILLTACTPQNISNPDTQNPKGDIVSVDTEDTIEEFSYIVQTGDRGDMVGENIRVYDENGEEVFSLIDNEEAQYFFAIKGKYLILDNGTSASQRLIQIYDIQKGEKIFETDYYPGEAGIMLEGNTVKYYQGIDNSKLSTYPSLAICENEYDNGYIELYGYELGKNVATSLGAIKCAYFE